MIVLFISFDNEICPVDLGKWGAAASTAAASSPSPCPWTLCVSFMNDLQAQHGTKVNVKKTTETYCMCVFVWVFEAMEVFIGDHSIELHYLYFAYNTKRTWGTTEERILDIVLHRCTHYSSRVHGRGRENKQWNRRTHIRRRITPRSYRLIKSRKKMFHERELRSFEKVLDWHLLGLICSAQIQLISVECCVIFIAEWVDEETAEFEERSAHARRQIWV